jgi:hypothetical protein
MNQQMQNQASGLALINNTYQASQVRPEDRRNAEPITTVVAAVAIVGGMMASQQTLNPAKALDQTMKDLKQAENELNELLWTSYPETMGSVDDVRDYVKNGELVAPFIPSLEAIGTAYNSALDAGGDVAQWLATKATGNENWLDDNYLTRDAFNMGLLVYGAASTAGNLMKSEPGIYGNTSGSSTAWSSVSKVDDVVQQAAVKSVDLNKANHLFGKVKHNLDDVLVSYGDDMLKAAQDIASKGAEVISKNKIQIPLGASLDVPIKVNGIKIRARMYNDNGILKLSTAFK